MEIHHYTRASTLPLILQSGKIRFTRADCLDDLKELPFEAVHLSRQHYFVSSWVKSGTEKSGQWHRYADNHQGVCISFEQSPFPVNRLNFEVSRACVDIAGRNRTLGLRVSDLPTPFTKETMFGKGFILIPWGDAHSFGGDVLYVKDPDSYVRQFVNSTSINTEITQGSKLARVKSSHWEDQSEYRFTLMAIQGPDLNYQDDPTKYEDELLNLMEKWHASEIASPPPPIQFIDLPLDATMLNNMKVTLGSNISKEDRKLIKLAIQNSAPHAKVSESAVKAR